MAVARFLLHHMLLVSSCELRVASGEARKDVDVASCPVIACQQQHMLLAPVQQQHQRQQQQQRKY